MKTFKLKILLVSFLLGLLSIFPSYSQEEEESTELRIGFVTFLSGPAAGPFGVPARNSAEILVEAINSGTMPAPYDTSGISGAKIVPVFLDENSSDKVVDYRNLIERQNVDLVIGYISSGSCKAIAPIVEEIQVLTVFFDCGTPQIFEEVVTNPKYLFRTNSHATMDNVAAAKYVLARMPEISSIAGINQNYAWGQDSWRDFSEAMQVLSEGIEVTTEQFPQIFAGQYGAEISALLTSRSDVVHSSFWGGDMEAFILQGAGRDIFNRSQVILTTAESAMHRLAAQLPDGTIIGGRGPNGVFAPESDLNTWFRETYYDRYGTWPTYPSYHMALAILGVKSAYEAASSEDLPDLEDVITAFENLEYEAPSGPSKMALANGHQGIQGTAYGIYKYDRDNGIAAVEDVEHYPAECVNPPEGVKSLDWIASNFDGADCEAKNDEMENSDDVKVEDEMEGSDDTTEAEDAMEDSDDTETESDVDNEAEGNDQPAN